MALLCACSKSYVSVQKQRVGRSSLASTFVQSPDPRQKNPPRGQRLLIKWRIPNEELSEQTYLKLSIVYKNYVEEVVERPIDEASGLIVYDLLDERFYDTGGFLSYKAEVMNGERVVEAWRQQLWVEIIEPPQMLIDPGLEFDGPIG